MVAISPNMLAMSKIVLESNDYDFWTKLAKTKKSLKPNYFFELDFEMNPIFFKGELPKRNCCLRIDTSMT